MSVISGLGKVTSSAGRMRQLLPKAGISPIKIPLAGPKRDMREAVSIDYIVNANAARPGRYSSLPWHGGSTPARSGAVKARVKKKAREQELIQAEINKVDELFGIKPKR